jgi:cobalt-zinc-cadmium efflux system outer membrane protein
VTGAASPRFQAREEIMNRMLVAAAVAVALPSAPFAGAQVTTPSDPSSLSGPSGHLATSPPAICSGPLDPARVVACALAVSPEVGEARQRLAAVAGRRTAAEVLLPSNPVLSGVIAQRRRPSSEPASVLNWSVSLAQEIEVAGQRGARMAVADAEAVSQARRAAVIEQEVGAAALVAFFEASAAREALRFADDLVTSAAALARAADARAAEALIAGVEADVARAEAIRIGLLRAEASRRWATARSELGLLLGLDGATMEVPRLADATLVAPVIADPARLTAQALQLRGEIASAEAERRVLQGRLALHRRERVPNLTLSAFAERGEIDDRIFGLGLSIPLPLPAPVGRTRAGEIAETLAQVGAAASSLDLVRRRVRSEVARALAALSARETARSLFDPGHLARARADLLALRDAVAARQLPLRDAVAWQRSLTELLAADIETQLLRALAVIDLRRVVGLPLVPRAGDAR